MSTVHHRHGSQAEVASRSDERRFGERVKIDARSGCWIYNGKPDEYGSFQPAGSRRQMPAHHYTLQVLEHRRVPRGFHVHHKCQRPGCVNPAHLEILTPTEHRLVHAALGSR